MRQQPLFGILLIIVLGLLNGCASVGTSPSNEEPHPAGKPGDISFGTPEADLMYDILVGEIATQRGQPEVAATFYLDAAKKSRDAEIASRAARIASFAKEKDIALQAAKIWSEEDPDNLEATRILAVFYIRNGQAEPAKALITRLLDADADRTQRTVLHVGAMLQREADPKTAVEISDFITQHYPQFAETHYVHASLLIGVNETQQALSAIEKALAIKPDWVDAITLRARIMMQLGQNEEAMTYLGKYLKTHPNEDNVRLTYARALVDLRKLEEARSQFELLAVKMPDNEDVLFTLAMLSMQFHELDEAEGYLKQLYKTGKTSSQIMYYLGQIAEQKENDAEALKWYSKIDSGEYHLDAQLRIAAVLARTNSIDEALEHIHALELRNRDEKREVILFEGTLLKDAKLYSKAYKLYTRSLDEFPNDLDILYSRALVAERLDKIDEVIRDLKFVIKNDPDNAAAHNALGYTLADRTDRYEEALQHVSKALELEPEDPAVIDSIGWVYYRLGQYDKAIDYLRQAYKTIKDGEVAAHLGEALFVSGKEGEANRIWQEALEKFGDNEVLIKTMERFGQR